MWRPGTGEWFFRNSSNGTFGGLPWGLNGDRPVPADYDGDGKTDLAVFRPANGMWFIFGSQAGIYSQPFGLTGDLPTPNAFVY